MVPPVVPPVPPPLPGQAAPRPPPVPQPPSRPAPPPVPKPPSTPAPGAADKESQDKQKEAEKDKDTGEKKEEKKEEDTIAKLDAGKLDAQSALSAFLQETSQLERQQEVKRILGAFKLNPLEVLNVPWNATAQEVNKAYRDLSLLVHPDKFPEDQREEAQNAFNMLTAAKNDLLDEKKRAALNELVIQARAQVVEEKQKEWRKEQKRKMVELRAKDPLAPLPPEEPCPDPTTMPGFEERVKAVLKELLIDKEWRTRQLLKLAAQEEALAAKAKQEREEEEKKKLTAEQEWEAGREARVAGWRDWLAGKGPGGRKRLRQPRMPKPLAEDPERTYIKRLKRPGGQLGAGDRPPNEDDDRD